MIIVITGPSGSGKTTLRRILNDEYGIPMLKNVTTRQKRPGEIDGVDYLFVTDAEFRRMRDGGDLLEWVEYSGNCYGLKRADHLTGITVLEAEGAKKLKEMFPGKVRIVYLEVPEQTRIERMRDRGDTPEEVKKRVQRDRERFESSGIKDQADLVIDNTDIRSAVKEIMEFLEGPFGQRSVEGEN
jgi:guanylate kinase